MKTKSMLAAVTMTMTMTLAMATIAHAAPTGWVLGYTGKSTNAFAGDKRTKQLVDTHVPSSLAGDVMAGLGGPPDPVVVRAGRYLSASACVPHACPDKGFFWIDSRTGAALGAYLGSGDSLRIGSNSITPATLPAPARSAMIDWLDDNRTAPGSVQFIANDNRALPLAPAAFAPPAHFQPPPGGPSFDCARATTAVETTICSHPAVARQDLDLAAEVRQLQQGYDTLAHRAQVTALQRAWLRTRDSTCAKAADMAACLDGEYRRQHDRLQHWVPQR
jgi:uncharacterized protein YecT (DUF1311 family)